VFPATVVTRTKPEARSIFSLLCERQGKPYLPPADSEMPDSAAQLQSGDWYISLANSC
jgi:hypothetical protein